MRGKVDWLHLFGLSPPRLDAALTVLAVAALAASRYCLLASGPWEWDETLFARGMLDFNLAAHFPHPPGFPGWLAIGHLVLPLAGEPLRALQWASAAFSVLALWPLASLGRRVAGPALATLAALAMLMATGPWLFAVRGFSSTAAGVLALGAAALAANGLDRWRVSAFSLLVTAAFLVRPILLPVLVVLWLGFAVSVRPLSRLLVGVSAGVSLTGVAVLMMVRAEGGWRPFCDAFSAHANRYASRLDNSAFGFWDLGMIKGLGTAPVALAVLAGVAIGLWVWWRKAGWRAAILWIAVLGVAIAQLLWLQNRSISRYAPPLQLAFAPLLAGAVSVIPRSFARVAVLVLLGVVNIARAYPLVTEQHRTRLAAWEAVCYAENEASRRGLEVVVEPELHPFASYLWYLTRARGDEPPPLVLSPRAPEPWLGVRGRYLVATVHPHLYLSSLVGREETWSGVSAALYPLTQQRMTEAVVSELPPLPIGLWWSVESNPIGERFMWGRASCAIDLPPLPEASRVGLDLRPFPGPGDLAIIVNGEQVEELPGDSPRGRIWIEGQTLLVAQSNRIELRRPHGFRPGNGDSRELAVQLYGVSVIAPGMARAGAVASEAQRELLEVDLNGAFSCESFGERGAGVWLGPQATVALPAEPGKLGLRLWAPRPTPPQARLEIGGRTVAGPLDLCGPPRVVWMPVRADDLENERLEVTIVSVPFNPAETDHGSDTRNLGVVLSHLYLEPEAAALDGAGMPP
jgi:hypothetical protein